MHIGFRVCKEHLGHIQTSGTSNTVSIWIRRLVFEATTPGAGTSWNFCLLLCAAFYDGPRVMTQH